MAKTIICQLMTPKEPLFINLNIQNHFQNLEIWGRCKDNIFYESQNVGNYMLVGQKITMGLNKNKKHMVES